MDFMGIGPLELLVILVIALIVVGPERLPEIAGSIGKVVRQVRSVSSVLTSEWQRELSAATQDIQGEDLKKALLDPLSEASAGVQKMLDLSTSPPTSKPTASRTAPPGGFIGIPSSDESSEAPTVIPSVIDETEEVVEGAGGSAEPNPAPEHSDLSDSVEEDAHAES